MATTDQQNPASRNPGSDPKDTATATKTSTSAVNSLSDSGLSNRPRDARLLHMVLSSYGVTAYEERVPLMLMDFAYRYTSSTLSDALHFSSEGYGYTGNTSSGRGGGGGGGAAGGANSNTLSDITLPALRLSIHSRTHYQYNPTLPSSVYVEMAQERNTVALPPLKKEWGTILPPEQYCLLGNGFQMEEEGVDEQGGDDDTTMRDDNEVGGEGEGEEDVGGEDVEGGKMEDIFGESVNGTGADDMED